MDSIVAKKVVSFFGFVLLVLMRKNLLEMRVAVAFCDVKHLSHSIRALFFSNSKEAKKKRNNNNTSYSLSTICDKTTYFAIRIIYTCV